MLSVQGSGASGTIAADVALRFHDRGDGTTGLDLRRRHRRRRDARRRRTADARLGEQADGRGVLRQRPGRPVGRSAPATPVGASGGAASAPAGRAPGVFVAPPRPGRRTHRPALVPGRHRRRRGAGHARRRPRLAGGTARMTPPGPPTRNRPRDRRTHDPDRHRHRRHLHRRRRAGRGDRRAGDHQDPVDPGRPRRRLHRRDRQGARPDGAAAGRPGGPPDRRGEPRHHGGDQPAAGGQGRGARVHHDRGLRGDARDRPAERARRLRQLLLLGEARPDRPSTPGAVGGWPAGPHRRRAPAIRRGRRAPGRRLVPGPWRHHARGVLPALVRQPRPRGADAPGARRGAPRRRRLDLQRGAAGVPRVRAVHDHARGRGGQAEVVALHRQHQVPARRLHLTRGGRPAGPVLRDEVQRRRTVCRRAGAPADHHRAVRPRRWRARGGADRPGGRLRPGADLRRRRHVHRRVRGHRRRPDAHHRGQRRRLPVQDPDDRHRHHRRRRRLGRLALPGGHAQGRPPLRRR